MYQIIPGRIQRGTAVTPGTNPFYVVGWRSTCLHIYVYYTTGVSIGYGAQIFQSIILPWYHTSHHYRIPGTLVHVLLKENPWPRP